MSKANTKQTGEAAMLLDILIVLVIFAGVGFGFWKGLLNQAVALLGIYLGALLGRFIYEPIGRSLSAATSFDLRLMELVAFLLFLILMPVLLLLGARAMWGSLRLPRAWGQIDLICGSLLGAVVGLLAAMVVVLAVGFLVTSGHISSSVSNLPIFSPLQYAWSTSSLSAPVIKVGHIFYYALLPNAGKTVPDILQVLAPH